MGGDGMAGLGIAIMVAMIAIMIVSLVVAVLLARLIGRSMKFGRLGMLATSLGLGFIGLAAGVLVVIATFYEDTWSPPPRIRFNLPEGFAHHRVILLEDPATSRTIFWRGSEMPFRGLVADIDLPASGLLRVRSLEHAIGRGDLVAVWSDGEATRGIGGGPAPAAVGATTFVTFLRGEPADGRPDAFDSGDADARAAYIKGREADR